MQNRFLFILLSLFFVLHTISLKSQNQANYWYFGEQAGLKFVGDTFVRLYDGKLTAYDGTSTISNSKGELLFYSNGEQMWDSTDKIMPNGDLLYGNSNSTSSSLFIPKPGDSTIYYLFTTDSKSNTNNHGLNYNEIDISLNNGLGDIIPGKKNIQLLPFTCEKLAATMHYNLMDIWLVSMNGVENTFYAFKIDTNGVNTNPVFSSLSSINRLTEGQMKISPTGNKMAISLKPAVNAVEVYDFNNANGKINTPIRITTDLEPYGIEFSPNGRLLYVSFNNYVYQYDISLTSLSDILASKYVIQTNEEYGGLQLGPDLKIYLSTKKPYLSAIKSPNEKGVYCNFVHAYIPGDNGSLIRNAHRGLPNYISNIFIQIDFENNCFGDSTAFFLHNSSVDSVIWNFNDPTSGDDSISDIIEPTHVFSSPGDYLVKAEVYNGGILYPKTFNVSIQYPPYAYLGEDITDTCFNDSILLDPGTFTDLATYRWSNLESDTAVYVTGSGYYWVEVKVGECPDIDTIQIITDSLVEFTPLTDTAICNTESIVFDIPATSDTTVIEKFWIGFPDAESIEVWEDKSYVVGITNQCGTAYDTVNLDILPCNCDLFVPNSFSPNEDGLNDEFGVLANCAFNYYHLQILSRSGMLIFESTSDTFRWDGKYKGKPVQQDLYTYVFYYDLDGYGAIYSKTGTIYLLH